MLVASIEGAMQGVQRQGVMPLLVSRPRRGSCFTTTYYD